MYLDIFMFQFCSSLKDADTLVCDILRVDRYRTQPYKLLYFSLELSYQHWSVTSSAVNVISVLWACSLLYLSVLIFMFISFWTHFPNGASVFTRSLIMLRHVGNKGIKHEAYVCHVSFLLLLLASRRAPFPPRHRVRELCVLLLQRDRSGVHHSWQGEGLVSGQALARRRFSCKTQDCMIFNSR